MADFRSVAGESKVRFDSAINTFVMAPSTSGDIALWGGGPNGEDLIIVPLNSAVLDAYDLSYVSIPLGNNLHRIRLKGKAIGRCDLEARLGANGPAWAKTTVVVGNSGAAGSGPDNTGRIVSIGSLQIIAGGNQADFLRQMYANGIDDILKQAREMMGAGKSEEEAARFVVQSRNELKVMVRNRGPELFKKLAEYRNQQKYGNAIGPDYEYLRGKLASRGIPAEKIDSMIIEGVADTSKGFNAAGGKMRFVGTVGEVVGFALMATQDSPDSLPPLPKTPSEEIETERARLRLGIPAGANIDRHGHLKKSSYLQIDTFDPHVGDEMASETEEILWALGVPITYHYGGVTWTVPGR